jgi:hypothetical protein
MKKDNIREGTDTGAGGVDDGPRFMYGNAATYMKYAREMAERLNMSVEDWLMEFDEEFEKGNEGIVDTVSYYDTGVKGEHNAGTDYHEDVSDATAEDLWIAHAERIAKASNPVEIVDMMLENTSGSLSGSIDDDMIIEPEEEKQSLDDMCKEQFIPVEGGYRQFISENFDEAIIADWYDLLEGWGHPEEIIEEAIDSELKEILDEKTYKDLRAKAPNYLNVRDKSRKTPGS